MNKTELILRIAEETGFSRKNVELGLNAAINLITKALTEEEKVQIVGFGAFETKVRRRADGPQPQDREDIPIPATKVPVFKAGKALKDAVDQESPPTRQPRPGAMFQGGVFGAGRKRNRDGFLVSQEPIR